MPVLKLICSDIWINTNVYTVPSIIRNVWTKYDEPTFFVGCACQWRNYILNMNT